MMEFTRNDIALLIAGIEDMAYGYAGEYGHGKIETPEQNVEWATSKPEHYDAYERVKSALEGSDE